MKPYCQQGYSWIYLSFIDSFEKALSQQEEEASLEHEEA